VPLAAKQTLTDGRSGPQREQKPAAWSNLRAPPSRRPQVGPHVGSRL